MRAQVKMLTPYVLAAWFAYSQRKHILDLLNDTGATLGLVKKLFVLTMGFSFRAFGRTLLDWRAQRAVRKVQRRLEDVRYELQVASRAVGDFAGIFIGCLLYVLGGVFLAPTWGDEAAFLMPILLIFGFVILMVGASSVDRYMRPREYVQGQRAKLEKLLSPNFGGDKLSVEVQADLRDLIEQANAIIEWIELRRNSLPTPVR